MIAELIHFLIKEGSPELLCYAYGSGVHKSIFDGAGTVHWERLGK